MIETLTWVLWEKPIKIFRCSISIVLQYLRVSRMLKICCNGPEYNNHKTSIIIATLNIKLRSSLKLQIYRATCAQGRQQLNDAGHSLSNACDQAGDRSGRAISVSFVKRGAIEDTSVCTWYKLEGETSQFLLGLEHGTLFVTSWVRWVYSDWNEISAMLSTPKRKACNLLGCGRSNDSIHKH